MSSPVIVAMLLGYLLLLAVVGWRLETNGAIHRHARLRGVAYALSLAALCTSWTYFDGVGRTLRNGRLELPSLIGPVLALTLFFPIWRRIGEAARRENVGSIADFFSSRYGKSRTLGKLVTTLSVVGAFPYIALQLSAIAQAWAVLAGLPDPPAYYVPIIIAGLAVFAIILGARYPALTRRKGGLLGIVAAESLVKMAALLSVAGIGVYVVLTRIPPGAGTAEFIALAKSPHYNLQFFVSVFLCIVTTATLPRQFHLGFVELEDIGDLKTGRWLFPIYMFLWTAAVVPMVIASRWVLSPGADPDDALINLAIHQGGATAGAIALLGGFSAGAAMVMVEAVTLSAMVSNEFVLPWLSRLRPSHAGAPPAQTIVTVRQLMIVAILVAAWLFGLAFGHGVSIATLGGSSMVASAQLAPALIGAVLWRRGHARGAIAGIAAGLALWLGLIVLPQLAISMWPSQAAILGWHSDRGWPEVTILSLALNSALYVGLSLRTRSSLVDRIQAASFTSSRTTHTLATTLGFGAAASDLKLLIERFLGGEDARRALAAIEDGLGRPLREDDTVTPELVRAVERTLAGAIGSTSARSVVALALSGEGRNASDVSQMLDEAAQAAQFSRDLLQSSLDSLDHGICVVDAELRLVAWNKRYVTLFGYEPQEVYVGEPLETLIRTTGRRRGMSLQAIEQLVAERLTPMRRREPQMYEQRWSDGLTLRVAGTPISSGEYVTSFTDVTELARAAQVLSESNEQLERRVQERTADLTEANRALAASNRVAEQATHAQARFVAAASHDLVQPLHAARLFLATAAEDLPSSAATRELLSRVDVSIDSADRLLRALLNLSRLEMDGVKPEFARVDIHALLTALRREFEPMARSRGVMLRVHPTRRWVMSDGDLLRSVLQNLIGNAVRYTPTGGSVLVGCRTRGDRVRVEVRDNGRGIAPAALPHIFKEFSRFSDGPALDTGAGLGLAIADRICRALGHELDVRSEEGAGSIFWVSAVRCAPVEAAPTSAPSGRLPGGLRVLCVEDDPMVLESLGKLLRRWGVQVGLARSPAEADRLGPDWHVVLADHQLGTAESGLQFLRRCAPGAIKALVTADPSEEIIQSALALQIEVIRKPVAPASLRAFITRASRAAAVEPV